MNRPTSKAEAYDLVASIFVRAERRDPPADTPVNETLPAVPSQARRAS